METTQITGYPWRTIQDQGQGWLQARSPGRGAGVQSLPGLSWKEAGRQGGVIKLGSFLHNYIWYEEYILRLEMFFTNVLSLVPVYVMLCLLVSATGQGGYQVKNRCILDSSSWLIHQPALLQFVLLSHFISHFLSPITFYPISYNPSSLPFMCPSFNAPLSLSHNCLQYL